MGYLNRFCYNATMVWLTGILLSILTALAPVLTGVPTIVPDFVRTLLGQRDNEREYVLDTSPAQRVEVVPEKELLSTEPTEVEPILEMPRPSELPTIAPPRVVEERVTAATPLSLPATGTVRAREALYSDGIFGATNARRYKQGLPILKRNAVLDRIAEAKVRDMFERQYFAHESPSGDNAGDLAKRYGYTYLSVGENLASGNFRDNMHVVQAWMDSPGHRANIMSQKYREIGIAAKKGTYEGYEVWMAVQTFGLPSNVCTTPDTTLLTSIEEEKERLTSLRVRVDSYEEALKGIRRSGTRFEELYTSYLTSVEEYNTGVAALKEEIEGYNNGVVSFNRCLSDYLGE